MNETELARYGTGNYEKCADCMAHCGYEGTAVADSVVHPLKALRVALSGVATEGPNMAPEIPLATHRPAEFVFESLVEGAVADMGQEGSGGGRSVPTE